MLPMCVWMLLSCSEGQWAVLQAWRKERGWKWLLLTVNKHQQQAKAGQFEQLCCQSNRQVQVSVLRSVVIPPCADATCLPSFCLLQEPAYPGGLSYDAVSFMMQALEKSKQKRPSIAQLQAHPWFDGLAQQRGQQ
eukprot:GHRR01030849.1.p1 GENE.GHRR01030849.1~~GHRR01030849.1.p1  ORF type:complete len:135 (+),score=41.31 GHRR01030849.1:67-471(+)